MIKLSEQWVRHEGITQEGSTIIEKQFNNELPNLKYEKAIGLRDELIDFVKVQETDCQEGERLPGSSEVIESIFGKQKYIEQNYAKEGFTSLILGIGALVGTLNIETVKEALVSTPVKTVTKWCEDKLGKT